jgi:hypothetical protein
MNVTLNNIDVTTTNGASDAIQTIDNALETINSTRSELGARKIVLIMQ